MFVPVGHGRDRGRRLPRDAQKMSRGTALVRRPSPRLADGIVTHIERTAVDVDRAMAQHEGYVNALRTHGWQIRDVEPADDCPDSVFVEDTLVVVGDLAVLARPGAAQRQAELAGALAAAESVGLRVARISEPATLDGGDVLQTGDTVYVGRGGRTNAEGIRQLRALTGRRVVPVPLKAVLHLKSAVTALPDGTFLALPDLVPAELFGAVRVVEEEAGCHVVPLGGDEVLMAASAPRTAETLADLGFAPVVVDIGEFEKLEGCVTCLSVLVWGA
jgi:dimethylargininase